MIFNIRLLVDLFIMKKNFLYLLLFIYILGVIKPTLPFVYDALAHAFFYQHHIATVHNVNGKKHVHHEFIKEAKKENSANNNASAKKLISTDEHIFLPFHYIPPSSNFVEQRFSLGVFNLTWRPIKGTFPPPKQQLV